jgi:aldehyde dehydrogenase (NAD+)
MKNKFVSYLKEEITAAYGPNPEKSPDFARIVNSKNWSRLTAMIEPEKVIFGGQTDEANCYIAPTLIDESSLDSLIMKDEIFGPLLPILSYESPADIHVIISKYEKPLSLYVFTTDNSFAKKIIQTYSFGGGCINDTVIHFSNKRLPFGGVGHSGIGAYHGSLSFDVFSHKKGIVKKANWLDPTMRYAPYKDKLATIKKLLKWM